MFFRILASFCIGVHVGQSYPGIPPVGDMATIAYAKAIVELNKIQKEASSKNEK